MEGSCLFYKIVIFFLNVFCRILYFPKLIGKENLPKTGGYIICINHKSNLDVVVLASLFPRILNFMAKEEMFKSKFSRGFFELLYAFPVRRENFDFKSVKKAMKVIKDGNVLAIFPEGRRARTQNLSEGEPGAALIALKTNAKIIPVGIKSEYKVFKKTIINIGKPIDVFEFEKRKIDKDLLREVTDLIMKKISQLSN